MSVRSRLCTVVLLGTDTPWLCPTCREMFDVLDREDRIRFLIGLSPDGANHLSGADHEAASPLRGATCRHCWAEISADPLCSPTWPPAPPCRRRRGQCA